MNIQTLKQYPVTTFYVAGSAIVFLLGQINVSWIIPLVLFPAFWPQDFWMVFTYGLVHLELYHIFLNMTVVLFIGRYMEDLLGSVRYFFLITLGIIGGGVLFALLNEAPAIGISAGGFAIIYYFGMRYPGRPELFLRLQNWQFLSLLTVVSILSWWLGWLPGIAHDAHLAGALVGVIIFRVYEYFPERRL